MQPKVPTTMFLFWPKFLVAVFVHTRHQNPRMRACVQGVVTKPVSDLLGILQVTHYLPERFFKVPHLKSPKKPQPQTETTTPLIIESFTLEEIFKLMESNRSQQCQVTPDSSASPQDVFQRPPRMFFSKVVQFVANILDISQKRARTPQT